VQAKAKEIRSLLNKREIHITHNEVQLSHNYNLQAKKNLTFLGTRVIKLETGLKGLAEGSGKDGKIMSDGEIRRRQDMLSELKEEKDTLTKLVLATRTDISKAATPASSMDRAALFKQPDKSMNKGIVGNGNSNGTPPKASATPSSRRVFGNSRAMPAETEQTRGLDNEGLIKLQQQTMEDQDQHVEQFSAILSRHKHIGLAIGQELDYQNQLLNELDADLDRTSDKLRFTTRKMNSIK
jgi:regulator of vacuolar morphogenesis